MKETLQNKKCSVEYQTDEKQIFIRDLTDHYNEPAAYSKSKRGLNKAWEAIKVVWTDTTTMHDVTDIFQTHNIKYHYWCMVD